jgi:hypothetical protein
MAVLAENGHTAALMHEIERGPLPVKASKLSNP